ncbi:FAD-dependent oxidoreductase [Sorangium sp. So ce1000]|uniref:FAD-dependent oxidoreductase n=1 Tax=Sorangium sp. So ce1000 TaxID=3133325 RepID=UPI003F60CBDD
MGQHRAIVIGTGFGGAVSACRLAQAGFAVTVFERGRRYDQKVPEFPRGRLEQWLWEKTRGLYDVRPIDQMRVVQSAGYGGGSLIYANVHLRAPAEVFARGWPEGYSREALDAYYDLVAYMLDIQPITRSPGGLPTKTRQMSEALAKLRRKEQLFYPPLAINFSDKPGLHPNKFGVLQGGCVDCGDCTIGCVHRSKNTLDMNYLPVAERAGATMRTECEVTLIEPLSGAEGPRYRVAYRDHGRGGQELFEEAEHVFVCAGSLGSTELLLRCKEAGALSRLSAQLGAGYSGNGDLLALGFDVAAPFEPASGPPITAGVVYAGGPGRDQAWFLIEDGGFPRQLWPIIKLSRPHIDWRSWPAAALDRPWAAPAEPPTGAVLDEIMRAASEREPPPVTPEEMRNTAMFLAMGRDLANGRLELVRGGKLSVRWDVPSNLLLYSVEERIAQDIVAQLGGAYAVSPFWRFAHLPITVHSLGGCRMGDSEEHGVTSGLGEVFNYPNLFVLDGAILPAATGVNPSHTIAAVTERNIERIIRRITGEPGWTPPERAHAAPYADPLTAIAIPAAGTAPPRHPGLGLTFRERLSGSWEGTPGAATDRRAAPRQVRLHLRITISYLARFISDSAHPGLVTGTLSVGGLTAGETPIREGVWNLFVATGAGPEREIRYVLPFDGAGGRRLTLRGARVFRPRSAFALWRLWRESVVLPFRIQEGDDEHGSVVGEGVARLRPIDVVHLLLSFRVSGAAALSDKARGLFGFLAFFFLSLLRIAWGRSGGAIEQ